MSDLTGGGWLAHKNYDDSALNSRSARRVEYTFTIIGNWALIGKIARKVAYFRNLAPPAERLRQATVEAPIVIVNPVLLRYATASILHAFAPPADVGSEEPRKWTCSSPARERW